MTSVSTKRGQTKMKLSGAYYNEIDPYCAQWLRNLCGAGLIADGDVDERSIVDVQPDDVRGYAQAHFFAGLGGWSYALRLAGWPDGRAAWTGSCPCQPFSLAGKSRGTADERHLWPAWFNLIVACEPDVVMGEQVAAAVGRGWLDAVFDDLEGDGYACGAATIPASGVGAPHKRDRLWFVAHAGGTELRQQSGRSRRSSGAGKTFVGEHGSARDVADADVERLEKFLNGHAGQRSPSLRASPWTVEPDVGRVAYGVPARVHKLRALGNAIVPQVAAEVISAFMEVAP